MGLRLWGRGIRGLTKGLTRAVRKVYVFRSVQRREDDGGEETYEVGVDEGGFRDPFAPPVPSEIDKLYGFVKSRLEAIDVKLKMECLERRPHA